MTGQQSPLQIPIGAGRRDQLWRVPAVCLVLAAITFAVFSQAAGFGFVNYDDGPYVYQNPVVTKGLTLKGVAWVFTHADCGFYHPLTMLSLMGDYQLHGLHAGGFHFTNVLLHAASVILLFLVLRQMTGALWRSAFVAAVFAIHPLRAESVAWIAERKDVLSGVFFMLTLWAYARYVGRPSRGRYAAVVLAYALGLLCKNTLVTLPFVLLMLDGWPLHRRMAHFGGLVKEKIPLFLLSAGSCVVTVLVPGKMLDSNRIPFLERLGNALVSYGVYLRQMVYPAGLAVPYLYPPDGLPFWKAALAFVLLAAISMVALACWKKRPYLLVGWLWYLGMLVPMIGIIQISYYAHADRFTYLPGIGLVMAGTWLVGDWSMGWQHRQAVLGGLMAAVIGALMVCACKQTTYWKSNETLWPHTLACTTGNYMGHDNLGSALFEEGRVDEAIIHYKNALQIKPDFAEACLNLGNALLQKGCVDDAITQYRKALQIKPAFAMAHNNLGAIFRQEDRVDDAITEYQNALQIKPDYAEARLNLAKALMQKGRADEAITEYQNALWINPDVAEAQFNLGNALRQKGRVDEAITQFQQALQIKPDFAEAHYNLGNAFLQKGRVAEAISQYQQALQINSADTAVQNNLAWLLATCAEASLRNGNKAVELARQANALTGGENPIILHTLAAAFAEAGRFPEAVETAKRALRLAGAQSNTRLAGQLQSEIKLYQAGMPFHSLAQTH
jgi:protein O-mannosyl-transferase